MTHGGDPNIFVLQDTVSDEKDLNFYGTVSGEFLHLNILMFHQLSLKNEFWYLKHTVLTSIFNTIAICNIFSVCYLL